MSSSLGPFAFFPFCSAASFRFPFLPFRAHSPAFFPTFFLHLPFFFFSSNFPCTSVFSCLPYLPYVFFFVAISSPLFARHFPFFVASQFFPFPFILSLTVFRSFLSDSISGMGVFWHAAPILQQQPMFRCPRFLVTNFPWLTRHYRATSITHRT